MVRMQPREILLLEARGLIWDGIGWPHFLHTSISSGVDIGFLKGGTGNC